MQLVIFPTQWILNNVLPQNVEFFFIANDVFIIVALPKFNAN